ncbi:MAG TPA: hypothetical protein VGB73_02295 [Pyrinomonadaceae bacterium]|jgi:hypothetical protein
MKEGDVVIVPMSQADGMVKNRLAILLREMPPFRDALICGVSTQLHQAAKDFDEIISPGDADFCCKRFERRIFNQAGVSSCRSSFQNCRLYRLSFNRAA